MVFISGDEIENNSFNRYVLSTYSVPGPGSLRLKGVNRTFLPS